MNMSKNLNSLLDQDFIVNSVDKKLEDTNSKIIKVIGVGGGGSNAVNYMYNKIKDVDFVVCNTDRQALLTSPVPTKIQLGPNQRLGSRDRC
jgi:cell division protein FtsZ